MNFCSNIDNVVEASIKFGLQNVTAGSRTIRNFEHGSNPEHIVLLSLN